VLFQVAKKLASYIRLTNIRIIFVVAVGVASSAKADMLQLLTASSKRGRTSTASLAAYFGATYIDGEFAPEFWSQFDNEGPRTTNLVEG